LVKSSATSGRVIIVGSLNVDSVLLVTEFPRAGETVSATGRRSNPGGKGGNQAIAAASTGIETLMVGAVGCDEEGGRYLRHLQAGGVNTDFIVTTDQVETGSATVLVDRSGQNSIVVSAGANDTLSAEHLRLPAFRPGDVVLVQLEIPLVVARAALHTAASSGAYTVLNASPIADAASHVIADADLVIVNEIEALDVDREPSHVCITRGADGASWADVSLPAPSVDVVDTTGAGDVFAGILAAGIAELLERQDALARALTAASAHCSTQGAQRWRAT
jgi:ribokinase